MKNSATRFLKGFTILELLAVIVIAGILTGMIILKIDEARTKSFEATMLSDLRNYVLARELHMAQNTGTDASPEAIHFAYSPGV